MARNDYCLKTIGRRWKVLDWTFFTTSVGHLSNISRCILSLSLSRGLSAPACTHGEVCASKRSVAVMACHSRVPLKAVSVPLKAENVSEAESTLNVDALFPETGSV